MKMKTTSVALSLALASLVLPACGSKKKSKKNTTAPVVMFIHGDPKQIIAGSTQDKKSFLTSENFKTFDGFHFAGGIKFIEKEKQYNPKDFAEVEKDNSTVDDESDTEMVPYSFVQEGDRLIYRPENPAAKLPVFGFKVQGGVLELADIDGNPLAIEHYSLRKDGKAFSILGSFSNTVQGRGLVSLTFADSSTVNTLVTSPADKNFNFLNGHFPVKWESDISLDLCGSVPQEQKNSVQLSLEAWYADPLRNADAIRGVTYNVKTQYPPYSDVNSHCLYIVNNFKAENSTNFYIGGATLPAINFASKELIDSDIFMFSDHIGRELKGAASPTTIHEIGHFFGLGHEFDDEDQGHPHYRSVMGYSDGAKNVTEGDFKAIRHLYKRSLGDQARLAN